MVGTAELKAPSSSCLFLNGWKMQRRKGSGQCAPAQLRLGRGFPRTVTVVDFFNSQMQMCERGKMTRIEIAGLAQRGCVVGNIFFSYLQIRLKVFQST